MTRHPVKPCTPQGQMKGSENRDQRIILPDDSYTCGSEVSPIDDAAKDACNSYNWYTLLFSSRLGHTIFFHHPYVAESWTKRKCSHIYVANRSSSLKSLEAIVLRMKRKSNSEPMIINDALGLASHSENKESDTISIAIG
nr:hypothetical protein CFP56_75273 [Quercus suber]